MIVISDVVQVSIYILLSAIFSASEVSLFSIPREDMEGLKNGGAGDKRVAKLLASGEDTLITILLGNIFVNLMVVGLVGKLITSLVGNSPVLFFLGSTGILLILGEIVPKAIALQLGKTVIVLTSPLIILLMLILKPLVILFRTVNRSLLRWNYLFLLSSPSPYITNDEYFAALENAASKGDVDNAVSEFLKEMGDVMEYPLSRIVEHRTRVEKSSQYTIEMSDEKVTSVVKDGAFVEISWMSISRTIGDVVLFFRESGKRLVLVHDEYGQYYGIATADTIFNYLSQLYDEENIAQKTIELNGSEPVSNYIEWFDDAMLDKYPDIRSVGGLLTALFESIPSKGAIFESESCIFEVLDAEQNSVGKLRITRK